MALFINGREYIEYTAGLSIANGLILTAGDIDMSTSGTGVYDIILKDAVADALSIRRGATDMVVFDSSTPKITITPNVTLGGSLTGPATLTIEASTAIQYTSSSNNKLKIESGGGGAYLYGNGGFLKFYCSTNNPMEMFQQGTGHLQINRATDGLLQAFQYGAQETGVTITSLKVAKVAVAYTGTLFDAAGTTDSATIWTQPANTCLIAIMMRLNTQFAGTAITSVTVSMGDAGDNDGLLLVTGNLTSDAANTEYEQAGAYYAVFTEGLASKRANASGTKAWIAYATSAGGNLNALTAGQLDFYVLYEEA